MPTTPSADRHCLARTHERMDADDLRGLLARLGDDTSVTALQLKHTGLTGDLVAELANFLATNATLTELNLTGNPIGTDGVRSLAIALRRNRTLRHLVLANCALKSDAMTAWSEYFDTRQSNAGVVDAAATVATSVSQPEPSRVISLHHLNLSGNQIDDDAADTLDAMLMHVGRNPHGEFNLDLRKNALADQSIKRMAAVLQNNQSVLTIKLEGNLDDDVERATLAAWKQIEFYTRRNQRHRRHRLAMEQIHAIRVSSWRVACCCFDFVSLSLKNADTLSEALRGNLSVTRLRLRDNALPPEGTKRIVTALEDHPAIQEVTIIDNDIGDIGMMALRGLLRRGPVIRSLIVSNSMSSEPALLSRATTSALHHALSCRTTSLKNLSLAHCQLTDQDIGVIVSGIAWACQIEFLELRNNPFGDRSVYVLVRLLQRCRALYHLDISGSQCTLPGILPIAYAVAKHTSLRELSLGRFPSFDDAELHDITATLARSESLAQVHLMTRARANRCATRITVLHEQFLNRRQLADSEPVMHTHGQQQQLYPSARQFLAIRRRAVIRFVAHSCVTTWLQAAPNPDLTGRKQPTPP